MGVCAIVTLGCGEDDDPGPAGEDPAAHACEHVADTGTAVTAGTDRAGAPAIAPSDEPYTVTVLAGAPSFVRIDGGIDALLFTQSAGAVIGLYHEQETTSVLPAPEPNADCPAEIPEHFDLALDTTGAWYVELAPAATPSVWLALTEAAGHAHE
jgi:hypothetical protein